MQTVTVQDAVAALPLLQAAIPHLNASRQSFALDLIHYHARKNKLTPGQAPWVGKLIDMAADAMEPTDADAAVDLADVTAVKAFFDRARCHLKAPAVLIQVPDVGLVRVYIGKENARRFAGKMVVGDEWGQKPYPWVAKTYGLITDDGKFEPRKGVETPAGPPGRAGRTSPPIRSSMPAPTASSPASAAFAGSRSPIRAPPRKATGKHARTISACRGASARPKGRCSSRSIPAPIRARLT
jgi:hypothetical protein